MDTPYPVEQENTEIVLENASSYESKKVRVRYRNCTLTSKLGSHIALFFSMQQWEKSTILAKKPVKRQKFFHTRFHECAFFGKYAETDFGFNSQLFSEPKDRENFGQVVDCDFSEAHLEFVRFYCDVGATKFPSWPYFTVFRPTEGSGFFERSWPSSELGRMITSTYSRSWDSPDLFAYAYHAPSLIKEHAPDTPLVDLQSILSEYDFIKF